MSDLGSETPSLSYLVYKTSYVDYKSSCYLCVKQARSHTFFLDADQPTSINP